MLERTPQSGNLIASEIVKCEHLVAIKRGKAIENLNLESRKPDRIIMNRKMISRRRVKGVRHSGSGAQKSQLHDLLPPPLPDSPDVLKEPQVKGVRSLSCVVEERISAPKAYQSRSTSTVEAPMRHHLTPHIDLKATPWEPPGTMPEEIYKPT